MGTLCDAYYCMRKINLINVHFWTYLTLLSVNVVFFIHEDV